MNVLFSQFVIDGVPRELTPAQLLGDYETSSNREQIVDETVDSAPGLLDVDPSKVEEYASKVNSGAALRFPTAFSEEITRSRIALALIDSIWREGNVRLEDLPVTLKWFSNQGRIGNMAALYSSVEAAVNYIDDLGLVIRRHSFSEGDPDFRIATPFSGAPLLLPQVIVPDPSSWIVYIPFDTSDYRLGGSLLAQQLGMGGGCAPKIADPDYFMDCFELVRELVEDGVAVSGVTVGEGGMTAALQKMTGGAVGISADVSDILRANDEKNLVRVLFAEVPGVLVQIRNLDFDYIDAECLLQDIAFFPLGHPLPDSDELVLKSSRKTGIQNILESLMQNAEGED